MPRSLSDTPTWTRGGRAEWLDDGVRLRCRPDPSHARFELVGLLIAMAATMMIAAVILAKTWSGAAASLSMAARLALSALAVPMLAAGIFAARAAYRHCRHGPPEDVFDRSNGTFRSGMDHDRPLPFENISHLSLRQVTGILYIIEVHSRHATKPALTRVRLTQPSAGMLAAIAAEVTERPFRGHPGDSRGG
jgi:hypothetical protein